MEIRSVQRYGEPRYPTHRILEDHPELLTLVPERWQGNRLVLAALGMAGGLVLSSHRIAAQEAIPSVTEPVAKAPVSMVAPLFVHGAGRGSTGCVVTNPPAFLSEEEGRAVVLEEFASVGLLFETDRVRLGDVTVPAAESSRLLAYIPRAQAASLRERYVRAVRVAAEPYESERSLADALRTRLLGRLAGSPVGTDPDVDAVLDEALGIAAERMEEPGSRRPPEWQPWFDWPGIERTHAYPGGEWPSYTVDVRLDATDWVHGVSFEYISAWPDFDGKLGRRMPASTVQSFATDEVAELLRFALGQARVEGAVGVFYDPIEDLRDANWFDPAPGQLRGVDYDLDRERTKERARAQLRAQVRDFIEWLKAEGIV